MPDAVSQTIMGRVVVMTSGLCAVPGALDMTSPVEKIHMACIEHGSIILPHRDGGRLCFSDSVSRIRTTFGSHGKRAELAPSSSPMVLGSGKENQRESCLGYAIAHPSSRGHDYTISSSSRTPPMITPDTVGGLDRPRPTVP